MEEVEMIFRNKKANKENEILEAAKRIADIEKNVRLNPNFLDKINREFTDKSMSAIDDFLKSADKILDTDELGDAVNMEVEIIANEISSCTVLKTYEIDKKVVEEALRFDDFHAPAVEMSPNSDKAKVSYFGKQNLPAMPDLVQMALDNVAYQFHLNDATVMSVERAKNDKNNKDFRDFKVTFSYTDSDGKHVDSFFINAPQLWRVKDMENFEKVGIDQDMESDMEAMEL